MSDVHEAFHCLDDEYLPNTQGVDINYYKVHQSEVFAEIGSLLYLKKKGYENINETRALIRTVGSYMSGRYIEPGPFSPGPWGAIYSLQKSIRAINLHFEYEVPSIWYIDEITNFSKSITELDTYSSHAFYGLSRYHKDEIQLIKDIEKFSNVTDYDYLRDRFLIIKKAITDYQYDIDQSLSLLLTNDEKRSGILEDFDFDISKHCPQINYLVERDVFNLEIDKLREHYYQLDYQHKSLEYYQLENIYNCRANHTSSS